MHSQAITDPKLSEEPAVVLEIVKPPRARPAVARPVFARHAASLIVIRDGANGPEILMGIRGAGHRFMPNRLVFPGGAVDPADRLAIPATPLRQDVTELLQRNGSDRLARAIAIAAARELQEETGLSLGTPPRLDALDYLCRAVTPPESPIRFNARFLVVPATATEGEPHDSHELNHVGFRDLDAVLRENIVLVTREVLERLRAWLLLPEAARRTRLTLDVFRRRRWGQE